MTYMYIKYYASHGMKSTEGVTGPFMPEHMAVIAWFLVGSVAPGDSFSNKIGIYMLFQPLVTFFVTCRICGLGIPCS
jgi:hypothetical protein